MKYTLAFIVLILLSFSAFAQDQCNSGNVSALLGYSSGNFYSRKQANDCLLKIAKAGKSSDGEIKVSVDPNDPKMYGFEYAPGLVRYLKLNDKNFFATKRFLGGYKLTDKKRVANKVSGVGKFIELACPLTKASCEQKDQVLNKDYCRCEPKVVTYCGKKKLSIDQKIDLELACQQVFNDDTCECKEELFCGSKKLTAAKKESAQNECLEAGNEWSDESCSCSEPLVCGEKKLSLKAKDKAEAKCKKDESKVWDPETCSCETDPDKVVMCGGKEASSKDIMDKAKECADKNGSPNVAYSWNQETCSCDKTTQTMVCGDKTVSMKEFTKKKNKCLNASQDDIRYSWNQETCECSKEKDHEDHNKTVSMCGDRKMSQNKIDRKKNHCDSIKGKWDPQTCKCEDPCYEAEEEKHEEISSCDETEMGLGDVKLADLAGKVCDQAVTPEVKAAIQKSCSEKIKGIYDSSADKGSLNTIATKVQYTFEGEVICGDNMVSIHNEGERDRPLPNNVPTPDISALQGNCASGLELKGDLKKYRPYGKISCAEKEMVEAANKNIVDMVDQTFDKLMVDLNIQDKQVTKDEMDKILQTAQIKLQVLGTANRMRNGTDITLDALAKRRQVETEKFMKSLIVKKLQAKVQGGAYQVPDQDKLFQSAGVAKAFGPLNPASPLYSMKAVLNEPETPANLKKCAGLAGKDDADTRKKIFDCSVDYFVDEECPSVTNLELKGKFCPGDQEALRAKLKSNTTPDFLKDYKMYQVGISIDSTTKTPIFAENKSIEVDCSADITQQQKTMTETHVTSVLKVTKPGFFRRLKKECREERKELNEKYGKKTVRKAARGPDGIVLEE